jgi:surfactin family lipopeptide synthetase C
MQHNNIEDVYELSPMQQGILFHDIYHPESSSYFQQLYFKISTNLNVDYFKQAWEFVIQRHPVLRTSFHWEGLEKPVQVVHEKVALPFQIIELKDLPHFSDITQYLSDDRTHKFNLDTAPATRFVLLKDVDTFHFIWNYHHLLLDGWCLPILLQEVFTIYKQTVTQQPLRLPPKGKNYREYLVWLLEQKQDTGLAFWKNHLDGYHGHGFIANALALSESKNRSQSTYSHCMLSVPKAITTNLQQLARTDI